MPGESDPGREASEMFTRTATEWVVEQWCHAHPLETTEPVVISEVVVPAAAAEAVVAEAEVLCEAAAVVEAAAREMAR